MAKVGFSKFKLKMPEVVKITLNDVDIEVKTYLPVNEKLIMVGQIISNASDENRFINIGKLEVFFKLYTIQHYTNITFTDKQLEDPCKMFDLIEANGLYEEIVATPGVSKDIAFVREIMLTTAQEIHKYNNSIFGILDAVSQSYSNLNLDASEIQKKLADPDNLKLLKTIVGKLG